MSPLPRLLWTACGRPELRKKLEPSCLPTTLAAVSRVALGPELEDRRQRKSGLKPARSDTMLVCGSYLFPRHRDQFSIVRHTYTDFRPKRKWSWVIVPSGS